MDRVMVYPGAIPLETDILNTNKNSMIALSKLAAAILGTSTVVNGLTCGPTSPASMQVQMSAGEIYETENVDATAFSSLAADTTHSIQKQGIMLDTLNLSCAAPGGAGQSINYLIEAQYQDSDTNLTVLPYYNASNPVQAYAGPNNTGASQATVRKGTVTLLAKAGIAATTGTQVTPSPDAGYVGLWVVTVANGQSTITSGNIAAYTGSPALGGTHVGNLNKIIYAINQAGLTFSDTDQTQLRAAILNMIAANSNLVTGQVMIVPGNTPLAGTVALQGALLSRVTYSRLWAYAQASGNLAANDGAWTEGQFSPGDGVTTFRTPDFRGNFPRFWDNGRGIDSARAIGTLQLDAMQGHWHVGAQFTNTSLGGGSGGPRWDSGVTGDPSSDGTHGTPRTASETRPRNVPLLACIAY